MTNNKLNTAAALILLAAAGSAQACGSEPFVGEVCTFAFSYCPQGFVPANGTLLPISSNQALFSLLGVTYGGDGQSTFAVPDLQGRTMVGTGQQTPQTSAVTLGQKRGSESVALTPANLPASNVEVTLNALAANGTQATPSAGALLAATNSGGRSAEQQLSYVPSGTSGTQVALGGASGKLAGGGQAVATLPPQLGMTVCIATQGVYPMRP
ncbi:Phage Tail Collar Domain protein [compost metagenome]